jgi:hypothetical protein
MKKGSKTSEKQESHSKVEELKRCIVDFLNRKNSARRILNVTNLDYSEESRLVVFSKAIEKLGCRNNEFLVLPTAYAEEISVSDLINVFLTKVYQMLHDKRCQVLLNDESRGKIDHLMEQVDTLRTKRSGSLSSFIGKLSKNMSKGDDFSFQYVSALDRSHEWRESFKRVMDECFSFLKKGTIVFVIDEYSSSMNHYHFQTSFKWILLMCPQVLIIKERTGKTFDSRITEI